ncbi:MAG: peptidoglycan bridge formation glycyltransferase FemA/FemB family protein, partial [Clostridia bacterium]|nr:peptidoglycan bridge formation glycyltransferase FemA/FemB family protein [Clostridia bacterium]
MELLNFSDPAACEAYERFVQSHPNGSFTQSLRWTAVKEDWQHEAILSRDAQGRIRGTMLVLIKRVPVLRCTMLYAPRGPVCSYTDGETLRDLMQGVRALARQYRAYLFKCDPPFPAEDEAALAQMEALGFVRRTDLGENTVQCIHNYVLDIAGRSEEELLASFHNKWRYNIRLAERKGVVCRWYDADTLGDHMDEFYPLMRETGARDGFHIRSEAYLTGLLTRLGPQHCRLYLCYYEGRPVSGAITIQYAGKTCYVYGASATEGRSVMPNHLMQWQMIRWAVQNGDLLYDFQGIPYYYDETHPNYGVYRFKKGFNGRVLSYGGEFDLVLSPWKKRLVEWMYGLWKRLRRSA